MTQGGGYVSPVWGGYDDPAVGGTAGALRLGRDGDVPANMIDPTVYTHFSMRAYASTPIDAGLIWFSCPQGVKSSCGGGMPFGMQQGWHTYTFTMGPPGSPPPTRTTSPRPGSPALRRTRPACGCS